MRLKFREKSRCLYWQEHLYVGGFAVKIIARVKLYAIFQVLYFGRITPCAYRFFCRKWIFENQKRERCTCTTHHEWFLARWDYKCLPRRPSIFFEAPPIKVWFSAPFSLFQSCNGKYIAGGQENHGQSVCFHLLHVASFAWNINTNICHVTIKGITTTSLLHVERNEGLG